jgi:hypothetical protein
MIFSIGLLQFFAEADVHAAGDEEHNNNSDVDQIVHSTPDPAVRQGLLIIKRPRERVKKLLRPVPLRTAGLSTLRSLLRRTGDPQRLLKSHRAAGFIRSVPPHCCGSQTRGPIAFLNFRVFRLFRGCSMRTAAWFPKARRGAFSAARLFSEPITDRRRVPRASAPAIAGLARPCPRP